MNNEKEIILAIEEYGDESYFGYEIHTNKQVIKLLMYANTQCCEVFDCFLSEDNFDQFIGAELNDIYLTDTGLNTIELELEELLEGEYDADVVFVNIDTSEGLLQFVAYNSHNGYYGHDVIIKSNQLMCEEYI